MATTKYHINSNDEAKVCTATVRACRFGALDGPNHFDNLNDAQKEAEKRAEANEGGTFANTVKKTKKNGTKNNVDENGVKVKKISAAQKAKEEALAKAPLTGHMTVSELNREAKTTTDQKVLLEAVRNGSPRVRGSVLENTHLEAEVLRELYKTTSNDQAGEKERNYIAGKLNYPIEDLTPQEIFNELRKQGYGGGRNDKIYADNSINDEKADAIVKASGQNNRGISEIAFNKNNQITDEKRNELIDSSPIIVVSAIEKGLREPKVIDKFTDKEMENLVYSGTSRVKDPELLDEIANQMIKRDYTHGWDRITSRPQLPSKTINKLIVSGKLKDSVSELHHHPNTSDDTKKAIEDIYPHMASYGKAERATGTRSVFEAQKALTIEASESGTLTGWHTKKVQVDKEKVKEYGLTDKDVQTLFSYGHNVGGHYDPETGVFTGKTDSSG